MSASFAVFLSEKRFEHRVPKAFLPPGAQGWRVVELSLRTPWFIVTIRDHPDDCLRELMVAFEADLVAIITESKTSIQAIHRMLPASPNQDRNRWGLEALSEVRIVTSPSSGSTWWEFVSTTGTKTCWPESKRTQDVDSHRDPIWSREAH